MNDVEREKQGNIVKRNESSKNRGERRKEEIKYCVCLCV